jgi:hypothetical protein
MTAGNVALTAHIAKKQQHKLPGAARRRGAQARYAGKIAQGNFDESSFGRCIAAEDRVTSSSLNEGLFAQLMNTYHIIQTLVAHALAK